ncbi:uncharacterized protein LOC116084142 [Mastomys coucha]|uniref:uncharacterized protein LOC116084142 n=1 Tax=Mastomys coucha TaxID=35658 RepID=UPI0012629053|nr:uncharacterized protein LOC116084142 [Mastomys coucha]
MTLKMDSSPGIVAAILLILGRTHGDSVTQTEGQVIISESKSLIINCTYSATSIAYPNLFWYVRYPGEGLQLLLKVITAGEKGSSRGFEATYNKETTSFHLWKASAQESDSAVYYCALGDTVAENAGRAKHKPRGVSSQQKVQQSPESLLVSEGTLASLNCTFSDRTSNDFRWYRQYSGKGLQLLVSIFADGQKKEGRFTTLLNKASLHLSLHIRDPRPSDSAVYFCAVSTQCSPATCSLHPNFGPTQGLN